MKRNKRKAEDHNLVGSFKSNEAESEIGFDVEDNSFELDEDNEDSFETE